MITIRLQLGRNDGNAVPGFRQRQQGMRGAACKSNVWSEPCEPTSSIEAPANHEFGIEQEQRLRRKRADIDGVSPGEDEGRTCGGKQLDGFKRQTGKPAIVRRDGMQEVLREVYLAAFEHCQALASGGLNDVDLDVRKTLRVSVEKMRKHALDMLGRSSNLQHTGIAATKQLRPFTDCVGVVQQTAAVAPKLFPFAGQSEAAPDTIKKPKAQLLFEVADLAGQSRLGDSQVLRRL